MPQSHGNTTESSVMLIKKINHSLSLIQCFFCQSFGMVPVEVQIVVPLPQNVVNLLLWLVAQ